jgi:hypothetical protein
LVKITPSESVCFTFTAARKVKCRKECFVQNIVKSSYKFYKLLLRPKLHFLFDFFINLKSRTIIFLFNFIKASVVHGSKHLLLMIWALCSISQAMLHKVHNDYLIHDTPTARKQKKHLYESDLRTSTIETFETEDKIDENAELYADLLALLNNEITWHELIRKKPKRIHMIANIKVAYDLLYFETYGIRYFERNIPYARPHQRQPMPN